MLQALPINLNLTAKPDRDRIGQDEANMRLFAVSGGLRNKTAESQSARRTAKECRIPVTSARTTQNSGETIKVTTDENGLLFLILVFVELALGHSLFLYIL